MSWSDWAAIAQIVATLAIVPTLIYLAREVSQAARIAQAESNRESATTYEHFLQLQDSHTRMCFRRGLVEFDELSPDDKMLFHTVVHPLVHQAQGIFKDHELKLIDDDLHESWLTDIAAVLSSPGGRQWWGNAHHLFAKSYVQALDERVRSSDVHILEILPYYAAEEP